MCVETCSEQPATSTAVGMAADRSCCTNRKLIYDFLLVINTNLPPILRRFQVMAQFSLARGECLTLTLLLGVIPANIPVIDISLKSGFFGLDFCRRKYRCILRKVSRDNFPPTIPPRENLPRPNKTPGNSPEFFPEQFPRHFHPVRTIPQLPAERQRPWASYASLSSVAIVGYNQKQ